MKQIVRVLFAVAALSFLTLYFFCDLVLIEPVGSPSGTDIVAVPGPAGPPQDSPTPGGQLKRSDELNSEPGVPHSAIFRGITGVSGGAISSFKTSWRQLYLRWPVGRRSLHKYGRPLSSGVSAELHERVGALLTLICLGVAIGSFSLIITLVEERART